MALSVYNKTYSKEIYLGVTPCFPVSIVSVHPSSTKELPKKCCEGLEEMLHDGVEFKLTIIAFKVYGLSNN